MGKLGGSGLWAPLRLQSRRQLGPQSYDGLSGAGAPPPRWPTPRAGRAVLAVGGRPRIFATRTSPQAAVSPEQAVQENTGRCHDVFYDLAQKSHCPSCISYR